MTRRPPVDVQVWTEFKVIQETSALTFMVAGTFKEIVTGEQPALLQQAGGHELAWLHLMCSRGSCAHEITSLFAVFSAVLFLGENFTAVNAVGLCILILGVVLFNWTKYQRLKTADADEGDKTHPLPASRPRYSLVDGSQASLWACRHKIAHCCCGGPALPSLHV